VSDTGSEGCVVAGGEGHRAKAGMAGCMIQCCCVKDLLVNCSQRSALPPHELFFDNVVGLPNLLVTDYHVTLVT
jgi:hypothetical protein